MQGAKLLLKIFKASLLLVLLDTTSVLASDNIVPSSYGKPDEGVPVFSDYAFMRGEWHVDMVSINESGHRRLLEAPARVTSFYHSDGRTVQTCFNAQGFHSSDVRAYDETSKVWRAQFLNAQSQRWNSLTSRKTEHGIETMVLGGYAGTENFDVKTEVSVLSSGTFVSQVFRRMHGKEAWRQTFELTYTRLPSKDSGPTC